MEAQRFDAMARLMAGGRSRRAVLRAALAGGGGAALAGLGAPGALAGKRCDTNLDCPKHQVCGVNRTGEPACVSAQCPPPNAVVCKHPDSFECCGPDRPVCCEGPDFALCCPEGSRCGFVDGALTCVGAA